MEKRRHKRLDLDVSVELEQLGENGGTTFHFTHVDVTDISRSGIGFTSTKELAVGTCYDAKIQIWTGEIICVAIEIVRRAKHPDDYRYGCRFTGMSDEDAVKIDVYQIFHDI